jgi:hypothetical protein
MTMRDLWVPLRVVVGGALGPVVPKRLVAATLPADRQYLLAIAGPDELDLGICRLERIVRGVIMLDAWLRPCAVACQTLIFIVPIERLR